MSNVLSKVSRDEYDLYVDYSILEDLKKEHLKIIVGLVKGLQEKDSQDCKDILNELMNSNLWDDYVVPYL